MSSEPLWPPPKTRSAFRIRSRTRSASRGGPVDDAGLHQAYDVDKQWEFGVEVARKFGYDFDRGRQDRSVHPFTTSFGINDVRITTRFEPDDLTEAIFSTMHERG